MALVQALLTTLSRYTGKVLNTLFGWATSLLYGKVPPERQIYLSAMSFASVLWIAVTLGIAFPRFGVFLLSFAKVPPSVDENWIRLGMLAACLLMPALTGTLSLFMKDPAERPKGFGDKAKAVLKGYPFTLALSISLLLMLVFAPFMKLGDIFRRWNGQHIQMVVEPEDYMEVVGEIQRVLETGGFATRQARPSFMLRLPLKIMTVLSGGGFKNVVADRLTVLKSKDLEALLLPFDLHVRAKKGVLLRVRALLARDLVFTKAFLTWNKEAQQLESRLLSVWRRFHRAPAPATGAFLGELAAIERDMEKVALPFEEWEVLFREKLLLEKALRQTAVKRPGALNGFLADRPWVMSLLASAAVRLGEKWLRR